MSAEDIAERIRTMEIRGAAEIARRAAQALKEDVDSYPGQDLQGMRSRLEKGRDALLASRPTAISLWNGVQYVFKDTSKLITAEEYRTKVGENADRFIRRSKNALKTIGKLGANRIREGDKVLTHCNSKAAIAVMAEAWAQGKRFEVYATESRPWRQGVLTANDLAKLGIPVTIIIDSAVRYVMKDIDLVLVGADTIASNGAVINKIGTSQVALAAHEARVPFTVCAETFKFSPRTIYGELVKIEERDATEVVKEGEVPPQVRVFNPVFDATPPEYIDSIVTEIGVIPPYAAYQVIIKELGQEFIFYED
ncbi:MAG TPA: ribose 1,5-bisphosphate isomerase [Methanomassiliicoccales archaeon]|nr:ribose 1,5-bisphosphate isomerase [Methanomassiliicoccales archaeon]